jgi:hypothetical protein
MIAFFTALMGMTAAMACPNLTGTYLCPGEAGEPDSVVVLQSSGQTLTYSEDGESITLVANGTRQTYTNFFNMDVLNVTATCQGQNFVLDMDGSATIDEGGFQMTINMIVQGNVNLNGSGDLVNTFDITVPQFGMNQRDSSTCIRQ